MRNPMEKSCAYLSIISKYSYPLSLTDTYIHIAGMAAPGCSSVESEAIGDSNIHYVHKNEEYTADLLVKQGCRVPVLCIVLPRLSSDLSQAERAECLTLFQMGCQTAGFLGAEGVLDNRPLLPLQYHSDMPVVRTYSGMQKTSLHLPSSNWEDYWNKLAERSRSGFAIAAKYRLDYHQRPCEGSLTIPA